MQNEIAILVLFYEIKIEIKKKYNAIIEAFLLSCKFFNFFFLSIFIIFIFTIFNQFLINKSK